MSIHRLQVEFGADGPLARDAMIITPHFEHTGGVFTDDDAESLCTDLANALKAWTTSRQIKVTSYNAQGPPPHQPQASATVNVGLFPETFLPREVAICLSFYAGQNRPRRRGRLYIPAMFAIPSGVPQLRPPVAAREKVAALVPIFTNLGGVDVDWCVYSRADDDANAVTNWWVDDEYDTVRSRGLRPTTRLSGTTGE